MPTGHMMSFRMTSKGGYGGILQFTIAGEWLEKRHQAVQGTSHIITYSSLIPRYVTHLLQWEQCSVNCCFTTYSSRCKGQRKIWHISDGANPAFYTKCIQASSPNKVFNNLYGKLYIHCTTSRKTVKNSTYRLQAILCLRHTFSRVTEYSKEEREQRNSKQKQKHGMYGGIIRNV